MALSVKEKSWDLHSNQYVTSSLANSKICDVCGLCNTECRVIASSKCWDKELNLNQLDSSYKPLYTVVLLLIKDLNTSSFIVITQTNPASLCWTSTPTLTFALFPTHFYICVRKPRLWAAQTRFTGDSSHLSKRKKLLIMSVDFRSITGRHSLKVTLHVTYINAN